MHAVNIAWYSIGLASANIVRMVIHESYRYGIRSWFDALVACGLGLIFAFLFLIPYVLYGVIRCRIMQRKERERYHIIPLLVGVLIPSIWAYLMHSEGLAIPDTFRSFSIIVTLLSVVAFELIQVAKINRQGA